MFLLCSCIVEEEEDEEIDICETPPSKTSVATQSAASCFHHQATSTAAAPTTSELINKSQSHAKKADEFFSSDSEMEQDGDTKRLVHSSSERKRRHDLRESYQTLRTSIPELVKNQHASKVLILRKAKELIGEVKVQNDELEKTFEQEKRRGEQLFQRLALLQSILQD